MSHLGFTKY